MSESASVKNGQSRPRAAPDASARDWATAAASTKKGAPWSLAESVAIWYRVTEALTAEDINQARSKLCLDERARCDRFVFERDKRDFAAAHALLRDALSRHGRLAPTEWKFGVEPGGKPFLAGQSELQFNIAHTRGLVVCALSSAGPIGVDVEPIAHDRDIDSISERYFAPSELADLRARREGPRRFEHFTELWTSKEAFLKALGVGLRRPLDEIALRFPGATEIQAESASAPIEVDWRFGLFAPRLDFRLAVAVRAKSPLRLLARAWPDNPDVPALAPIRWSR